MDQLDWIEEVSRRDETELIHSLMNSKKFPAPFVQETVLSPGMDFSPFVKD